MMQAMGSRTSFLPLKMPSVRLVTTLALAGVALLPVSAQAMQPQLWGFVPRCAMLASADLVQPLTAQVADSKSTVILGGVPSKLDLLRAQQAEPPTPGAGPDVAASCMARIATALPTDRSSAAVPTATDKAQQAVPDTGRPDVFGSIALSVGRTPLDHRWTRARNARLGGGAGPWAQLIRAQRGLAQADQIAAVNIWVNARIAFADDIKAQGVADQWASAAQSLTRGRGDCEDYAIAKMQLLTTLGVDPSDIYLVIARDLVRQADHAVLVVRSEGRLVVLDNGTDRVLDARDVRDYRPIMSYSGNRAWLHGYAVTQRASPAPVQTTALR
jgi:predicted transglutaminase-like cysteine proteinase